MRKHKKDLTYEKLEKRIKTYIISLGNYILHNGESHTFKYTINIPEGVNYNEIAYSEHARRYLAECGLPKERTYVTGSPMAEVLHNNLDDINKSDILDKLGLQKKGYMLLSAHREENIGSLLISPKRKRTPKGVRFLLCNWVNCE